MIKVGSQDYGMVEDITLRHTVIRNFNNNRIVIPNAIISDEVLINNHYGEERVCHWIEIGIAYGADLDKAIQVFRNICETHELCADNRTEEDLENDKPKVVIRVVRFDDSAVVLRALVWVDNPMDAYPLNSAVNRLIRIRFEEEGIEIPFPYRTIVMKNEN